MIKANPFHLAIVAAIHTACATGDVNPADDGAKLQALEGTWESPEPEEWYGAYGRRRFTFDDGRWSLVFDFGFDPDLNEKVFTFETEGGYRVGEPSSDVPGAYRTVFFEETKSLTFYPGSPSMMEQFGVAECGLVPGDRKDISRSGCGQWKPVSVCGEDHDLFAIDGEDRLYFGVRPRDNDMCTAEKTPTALLPPVVRVSAL